MDSTKNITCGASCPLGVGEVSPCSLLAGHACKHCNGGAEWHDPCAICGSREAVRRFAVTIDDEPLALAPCLCGRCGYLYLLSVGRALGDIARKGSRR